MLTADEVRAVPLFAPLPELDHERLASSAADIHLGAAEIARDSRGYIATGEDAVKCGGWSHNRDPYLLESSVPGIFACGDVRLSPVKRVASAVGEGSMAISFVHQYLRSEVRVQLSRV